MFIDQPKSALVLLLGLDGFRPEFGQSEMCKATIDREMPKGNNDADGMITRGLPDYWKLLWASQ